MLALALALALLALTLALALALTLTLTAVQGVAAAEAAFQNSLWYAKDRKSMRALSGTKVPEAAADPIIWQPSVRTMLLTQKAVAEGGRSMACDANPDPDYDP